MNKNMIDNLFRLDEQTNRKGTEGESGTGLVLSSAKSSSKNTVESYGWGAKKGKAALFILL